MPATRRFPPPWTVEETAPCFIVRDHNGQALAFVYCEDEPGRRSTGKLLTRDEARRIAANIAKLPGLLLRGPPPKSRSDEVQPHFSTVRAMSAESPTAEVSLVRYQTFIGQRPNRSVASSHGQALACPRAAHKTGNIPKSPLFTSGSADAIGRQNSSLNINSRSIRVRRVRVYGACVRARCLRRTS
jgi:hypothetical protein